jgi:hypothetical protein
MVLSSAALVWLEKAPERGGDIKKQAYLAGNLAVWAKVLPALFPAGSGPRATFIAATTRLTDLAKAGDLAGFKAQVSAVSKSCDECHQEYKD